MSPHHQVDVLQAIDELRFAEIYLYAVEVIVNTIERSEEREAVCQLVSDCSHRLSAVMGILEDGCAAGAASKGRAA